MYMYLVMGKVHVYPWPPPLYFIFVQIFYLRKIIVGGGGGGEPGNEAVCSNLD